MTVEERLKVLMHALYDLQRQFQRLALESGVKGAHHLTFKPDGKMVGDIGELFAAHRYGLEVFEPNRHTYDGQTEDGRYVQVRTTQDEKGGTYRSKKAAPDNLLVLLLRSDGTFGELYNGPGEQVWSAANNSSQIAAGKLTDLHRRVLSNERILPRQTEDE